TTGVVSPEPTLGGGLKRDVHRGDQLPPPVSPEPTLGGGLKRRARGRVRGGGDRFPRANARGRIETDHRHRAGERSAGFPAANARGRIETCSSQVYRGGILVSPEPTLGGGLKQFGTTASRDASRFPPSQRSGAD